MIDPESVDLQSLPWLPIEAIKGFPGIPSVYFVLDGKNNVYYIGKSNKPNVRWLGHNHRKTTESIPDCKVAFLFVEESSLLTVEDSLIHYYNPLLNKKNNPRWVGSHDHVKATSNGVIKKAKASLAFQLKQLERLKRNPRSNLNPTLKAIKRHQQTIAKHEFLLLKMEDQQ